MTTEQNPSLPDVFAASRVSLDRIADLNAKRIAHLSACLDSSNKELERLRAAFLLPATKLPANVTTSSSSIEGSQRSTARKPRITPVSRYSNALQDCSAATPRQLVQVTKPSSTARAAPGSRTWTADEQARFATAYELHGPRGWTEIAAAVGTRTQKQIRAYAQRLARRGAPSKPEPLPAVLSESPIAVKHDRGGDEFPSSLELCPPSPRRAKLEPTPKSPVPKKQIEPPSSPLTPGPPFVSSRRRATERRQTRKVGFKGLGPFAAEALIAARNRMSEVKPDNLKKESCRPPSSCLISLDLPEGTSSMSCSSLSSCGNGHCMSGGPFSAVHPELDVSGNIFAETLSPVILEDTPLGDMLSIDLGADLDWSYLEQVETFNSAHGCAIAEPFALDGFLEAI